MELSPVGIEITNGSRQWKVGKILGKGACATVCSLNRIDSSDNSCNETEFAVKLAPLPKKKTKKGNSVEETNEKLLYYEHLVYNTQFQSLQGTFIPNVPKSSSKVPPVYGNVNGYRYFLMEKMSSTISTIVPLLLQNKSSSRIIDFGPIAVALFSCVRACHQVNNIIRDVKSDNFMLTIISAAGARAESTEVKRLASRIRLIDLAMVTQWTKMYSDTDEADFNGTPLYASLNVHSGKKASFRDDLEALGYVLAELLIQLNSGDPSKQLPWSHGKSDDDIWSIKKAFVEDENSEFYEQLGNDKTRRLFLEYLNIVRGYSFKKMPDYDNLSEILSKITLPRMKMTAPAASRGTTKSRRAAATKKMMPSKHPRTKASMSKSARRSTTKSSNTEDKEDHYMMSDEESIYVDASEEMDWENIVDENEKPKEDVKSSDRSDRSLRRQRANAGKHVGKAKVIEINDDDDESELSESHNSTGLKRGVRILVTEGPHKGEFFDLEAGLNEIVTIGSNPASKVGKVFSLEKDNTLQKTHVRLDFDRKNCKLTAIKVTDKSKSNGKTYVNHDVVRSTKAFINDKITIGNTALIVQTL
mmetsp:Transcript_57968/g.64786  ORF Transcript_57968/g.64786 Transcript_57968/m.64786 type:complete len:586 (-) Transcript_57968:1179-2936(-)